MTKATKQEPKQEPENVDKETGEVIDAEPVDGTITDAVIPIAPVIQPNLPPVKTTLTIDQLAVQQQHGLAILKARNEGLVTVRKQAIRETHPSDWTLFKPREGVVTAYLDDNGCARVRDFLGIQIFGVSDAVRAEDDEGFAYTQTGSGICNLTGQTIEHIEGCRLSNDPFFTSQGLKGIQLDRRVRQATRANLDGNIVRELAGLETVPVQALKDAWTGTNKRIEDCRKGRGFGTQAERQGAVIDDGSRKPDGPAPVCPKCRVPMQFKEGTNQKGHYAFWGCPNFNKGCKETVQHDAWKKKLETDQKAAQENSKDSKGKKDTPKNPPAKSSSDTPPHPADGGALPF